MIVSINSHLAKARVESFPLNVFVFLSYTDKDVIQNSWIIREPNDFYTSQVTAPTVQADATHYNENIKDEFEEASRPLREKNSKKTGGQKHVPHRDKPPQIVAKRNARERRRVQAVNGAFVRLRKALPIENSRGKRVSKVKTLQNAIRYIQQLQELIAEDQFHIRDYSFEDSTSDEVFEEFYFEREFER
ncbi:achaete-scute complex protein T3-like [Photinus pyralis]|uniref:achaete-scute complex protein T3-like n=1 Tax=Photinus pyralis TaxID=7054 RepID=UPI001266EB03|nr:achaete-scute complex protein T3-like [Photinus pyralis]